MALMPGVRGEGDIQEIAGRRYRRRLRRVWFPGAGRNPPGGDRAILFVGMNPSTADAEEDDRTCRREQMIARRLGFNRYLKANILDVMATRPGDIPRDLLQARTDQSLEEIRRMVQEAEWIVLAHGNLPPWFAQAVLETYEAIRDSGKPVAVFQFNRNDGPTHTRRILNRNIPANIEDARWRAFYEAH